MNPQAFAGLLTPYGGMTPYRQRHIAPARLLSRAIKGRSLPLVVACPVDGFSGFNAIMSVCGARQGDTGALDGNAPSNDLAFIGDSCQLRFLIISEVSLTGYHLTTTKKAPVSLALTGFEGF